MGEVEVVAIIEEEDTGDRWEETLVVVSLETAEEDVQKLVESFNGKLREGEKPRKLIGIKGQLEKEVNFETVYPDLQALVKEVYWEWQNAFGMAWCKVNYESLKRAIKTWLSTHRTTHLKKLLNSFIAWNNRKFERFAYLKDVDFLAIIREDDKERKARED